MSKISKRYMYILSCNIHSKQNNSNLITKRNGHKKNKKPFKHFVYLLRSQNTHLSIKKKLGDSFHLCKECFVDLVGRMHC